MPSHITIPHAAKLWGKHITSVRRAIDSRRRALEIYYSESVPLVSVASLIARWGNPLL